MDQQDGLREDGLLHVLREESLLLWADLNEDLSFQPCECSLMAEETLGFAGVGSIPK